MTKRVQKQNLLTLTLNAGASHKWTSIFYYKISFLRTSLLRAGASLNSNKICAIKLSLVKFRQAKCPMIMRMFHPVNSLIVTRNCWLILLIKISLFLNLSKHTSKNYRLQICDFFPPASVLVELLAILWLFTRQSCKDIWDMFYHQGPML